MLTLRLAKYPIAILVTLSIVNFLALWFYAEHWLIVTIVLVLIDLLTINQVVILLGTIPHKLRAISRLVVTNRRNFRPERFADYMNAPCGRQVARIALEKIGQPNRYSELRRKYQTSFLAFRTRQRTRVTFVKDNKTTITEL